MADLTDLSLEQASSRIGDGTLTSQALVQACLDRIESCDRDIGAWQYIDPPIALGQAITLDRRPRRSALHGIPIGVKDIIETADMPTCFGSDIYAGHRPPADASCVAILRSAGAVVLGKTVTTEFAAVAPSKTRNPCNIAHTPGGSSSGSAAAVSAKMVPAAFGTQTAGSIVRPASFCGIVGYKPTFGLIDRAGVKTLATSFDTVGLLTRSVGDAALLASVLTKRPHLAAFPLQTKVRIGVYFPPWSYLAQPSAIAAVHRAAKVLSTHSIDVVEAPAPDGFERLLSIQQAIMDWEMVHALSFERLNSLERLDPITRAALKEREERLSYEAYDAARVDLLSLCSRLDELFDGADALLTLSAIGEAPEGLSTTGGSEFNRTWTALHVPCLNIPADNGSGALPIGIQLVGRIGDDARTLAVARVVEQVVSSSYVSSGVCDG